MYRSFLENQNKEQRDLYIELLKITGSLSNLFSESENPFLYYRAMENIFCKSFEAKNLSRSDVSIDASKGEIGIGLKTYLNNNGRTYQKIAEFNKESYLINNLSRKDKIQKISEMRNNRIESTKQICGVNDMIYHLITREKNKMNIYEEPMELIDIDNLRELDTGGKNTIHFTDGKNEYNYSISKSTLLKRFDNNKLDFLGDFEVKILKDPFEFLLAQKESIEYSLKDDRKHIVDYIVLPLYGSGGKVYEKSGLNMWNASGRPRHKDEVYIPIPYWIHEEKEGFFKYKKDGSKNTESFDVELPNGKVLSMKVTQTNGKALQSNPNKDLGKWILRDILKVKDGELVTKKTLDEAGIDSIRLNKINDNLYSMDFLKVGSFEEYRESFFND